MDAKGFDGCFVSLAAASGVEFDLLKRERSPTVTYIGQMGPDEQPLCLVAEQAGSDEVSLRGHPALTSRKAEVLLWLSRGESQPEYR